MRQVGFGVGFAAQAPAPKVIEAARLAEQLGYHAFWVTDSHLVVREAMSLLGAIAISTERIKLGPGVSHLAGRHFSVLASAMATLNELAPGRIRLGIGVGDSGPLNLGLARSSLRELEAAVESIRALLSGQEIQTTTRALRLSYVSERTNPVRIYVAATGPRSLRLAGRVGDAALISGMPDDLGNSIDIVREGEREAGRAPGSTHIMFWTTVSVNDDRAVARAAVRGNVARRAMNAFATLAREGRLEAGDAEDVTRLQAAHRQGYVWDGGYAELVPERWIDRFAVAGTPSEVRRRLERVVEDGADEVSMILMGSSGGRGAAEQLTKFAESVMRPMGAPVGLSTTAGQDRT